MEDLRKKNSTNAITSLNYNISFSCKILNWVKNLFKTYQAVVSWLEVNFNSSKIKYVTQKEKKKQKKLRRVKRSAKLKPRQRVPSCCAKSSDVKFTIKPKSHVEAGGSEAQSPQNSPCGHDAATTAFYHVWSPGEGLGILSIAATVCEREPASSPNASHSYNSY